MPGIAKPRNAGAALTGASLLQIARLEARNPAQLVPVGEDNLPSAPLDQALPFQVGEDPVDVDRGLAGDVGDLLLRERVVQRLLIGQV